MSSLTVIFRHMPKGKVLALTDLPEDPDCLECLKVKTVRKGDFRKGLRAGIDYTVFTSAKISKGTVLGLYRAKTVNQKEEKAMKKHPPPNFKGTKRQWRQIMDAYTADIVPPAINTKAWKAHSSIYGDILQV